MRYNDIIFEYDSNGNRISKTTSNNITKYWYDDNKIIRSKKNQIVMDYMYDNNNQLIGFYMNGKDYDYCKDITGNINEIVDSNGNIMVKYCYTAYGEVTIDNPYSEYSIYYETAQQLIENKWFS